MTVSSCCGAFRDDSEPAEVPHHQPDSVQDVQASGATEGGVTAKGERAVAGRAKKAAVLQQAGILSG